MLRPHLVSTVFLLLLSLRGAAGGESPPSGSALVEVTSRASAPAGSKVTRRVAWNRRTDEVRTNVSVSEWGDSSKWTAKPDRATSAVASGELASIEECLQPASASHGYVGRALVKRWTPEPALEGALIHVRAGRSTLLLPWPGEPANPDWYEREFGQGYAPSLLRIEECVVPTVPLVEGVSWEPKPQLLAQALLGSSRLRGSGNVARISITKLAPGLAELELTARLEPDRTQESTDAQYGKFATVESDVCQISGSWTWKADAAIATSTFRMRSTRTVKVAVRWPWERYDLESREVCEYTIASGPGGEMPPPETVSAALHALLDAKDELARAAWFEENRGRALLCRCRISDVRATDERLTTWVDDIEGLELRGGVMPRVAGLVCEFSPETAPVLREHAGTAAVFEVSGNLTGWEASSAGVLLVLGKCKVTSLYRVAAAEPPAR